MSRNLSYLSLSLVLLLAACGKSQSSQNTGETNSAAVDAVTPDAATADTGSSTDLIAILRPTEGNTANGIVAFIQQDDLVLIRGELFDLQPGEHGFHIHAIGDCSAPDGSSAGGHFSIPDAPHGRPENMKGNRHTGDLGNVFASSDGTATYERMDRVVRLTGKDSIRGRAIILHAGEDDLTTQPSGDAGPRVACGVIE